MGRYSSDDSDDSDLTSSEEEEKISKKRLKRSKHSSSHKKKKSKDKKRKKSKKHRRRSSSSEEESDSADEWVVKSDSVPAKLTLPDQDKSKGDDVDNAVAEKLQEEEDNKPPTVATSKEKEKPANEDDQWMELGDSLQTFSNDSRKSERRKQKDREREQSSIDKPGQHARELNPYWKDGGTGLPEEKQSTQKEAVSSQLIGDGGLSYLRKAFIRAKEQSREEGRSLEDVVSERWGSLEKFLGMLEDAEEKAKEVRRRDDDDRYSSRKRFVRPGRDSDDDEDSHRHYSRDSRSHRHRDRSDRRRSRSRSRDRSSRPGWQKKRDSPPRRKASPSPTRNTLETEKKQRLPGSSLVAEKSVKTNPNSSEKFSPVPMAGNPGAGSHSSSSEPETSEPDKNIPKVLTDKEMNELSAKLLKAEMLGNETMVAELKSKIADAEAARQNFIKNGGDISQSQKNPTKVVTKVLMDTRDRGRKKDKISETHKDGQRIRYFPDDDKYTLKNMFQREKMNTAADENALFARIAGKGSKTGLDYDVDDVFTDKASSSKQARKEQEREVQDVLDKEKQYKKILDNCNWCFESSAAEKHLIVSVAEKSYICVPPYQSLTEGHCLIVPMSHVSSATELDEDVWAEMQKFRKALVQMYREAEQDVVVFETALFLKRHPHMYLECIPMPKETGELAPIYFKKAIQECETEWSQNKKLVDLRNRDVRRAVPKGLPYFSVDFGDDSCGFAHVVEDEKAFPRNFGHEIVGGMMELDHHLWRKQRRDDFKTQRAKVMEFLKLWAPHDWTRDAT